MNQPRANRGIRQGTQRTVAPVPDTACLHNKSYAITAEVLVPESGAEGVIVAMGGITGGWSLYCKAGKLKHCYNFFGLNRYYSESERAIPSGKHQVRMEFAYDGGGPAEGGDVSLFIDGQEVGGGRVDRTEPALFSADETCHIGRGNGSPVTDDYGQREFSGEVNWVELDLGKNAPFAERYLMPVKRLRITMGTRFSAR